MTQQEVKEEKSVKTRKDIRNTIFKNAKTKSEFIKFFGADIELRQPPLKELLNLQDEFANDVATMMAVAITRWCFVPDTNERIFDETDIEMIKNLPFSREITQLQEAINTLTGIDVGKAEANLKKTD